MVVWEKTDPKKAERAEQLQESPEGAQSRAGGPRARWRRGGGWRLALMPPDAVRLVAPISHSIKAHQSHSRSVHVDRCRSGLKHRKCRFSSLARRLIMGCFVEGGGDGDQSLSWIKVLFGNTLSDVACLHILRAPAAFCCAAQPRV